MTASAREKLEVWLGAGAETVRSFDGGLLYSGFMGEWEGFEGDFSHPFELMCPASVFITYPVCASMSIGRRHLDVLKLPLIFQPWKSCGGGFIMDKAKH